MNIIIIMVITMRAIIKFGVRPQTQDILNIENMFKEIQWIPMGEIPLIKTKKEEILSTVAKDDTEITENTCKCTIYDNETKTWGIVNEPVTNRFEVRLKNKEPDSLKQACEHLINHIREYEEANPKYKFTFSPTVSILEPHSENHAFYGNVLPRKKFNLAWKQRKAQAWAGVVALLFGLISLLLSLPIFWEWLSPPWQHWFQGNFERLSTAMVVAIVFSWLPVLQRLQELREENVIEWVLSGKT